MKKDPNMQEDDGFFTAPEEGQNAPQPQNDGGRYAPKMSKGRRVGYIFAAVGIALTGFFGGMLVDRLSLDKEMRSLIKVKDRIQGAYYEEVTDEEFYGVLFDAINEKILDPYSSYLTEEEFAAVRTEASGEQSGIGLVFSASSQELRVIRVCGNSPAEKAGVTAGDRLVGYGASADSITQSHDYQTFTDFLKNYKTGEKFFLQFETLAGETKTLELSKEIYLENYVFYRTNTVSQGFTGDENATPTEWGTPLTVLNDDTAYIRLTQFNGAAAEEFTSAMQLFKSQGKTDLVLDLRENGGGYLDIMLEIAAYFCKDEQAKRPVVAIADYGEYRQTFSASQSLYDEYFTAESKITVLADDGSASASECLLGCMLDYGAIGYEDICLIEKDGVAKTYGKGIMQTTYPLSGIYGDAIRLTTARILWPLTENCIHGVGITTDDGAESVAENIDDEAEIAAAIGVLYGAGI